MKKHLEIKENRTLFSDDFIYSFLETLDLTSFEDIKDSIKVSTKEKKIVFPYLETRKFDFLFLTNKNEIWSVFQKRMEKGSYSTVVDFLLKEEQVSNKDMNQIFKDLLTDHCYYRETETNKLLQIFYSFLEEVGLEVSTQKNVVLREQKLISTSYTIDPSYFQVAKK